jgi:hypothetical protein
MGTLTDEDLRHLLGEAGGSFAVPQDGAGEVLEAAEQQVVVPLHRRRWVQVPAAAAAVAVAVLGGTLLIGDDPQRSAQRAAPVAASQPESGPRGAGDDAGTQVTADGSVAGRSGESTGGGGVAAGAPGLAPAPAAALDLAGGADAYTATGGTSTGAKAAAPAAAPGAAAPVTAPVPDGARVVKTGAIALIVEDGKVTPTLTQVQGFATAVGGVVATAKTQESGPTPSGAVTLRVPVDSFEEVVAKVRGMGAEVRSATTSGQDVTAQYADLEAQLRTLTAARERFLEILGEARSIGDVLSVQQRVDDVTGKIDRLEGQRRVLAAQSEKATLEVTVTEADDPVVKEAEKPDDGLSKAFSDAWDGFTSGVEALIRLSGRGVLLLLCLGVAWVVLRLGWRASRRRLV